MLSKLLEIPRRTILDRCKGIPIRNLILAIKISRETGIPAIDLIFTHEFLEKNGITRDEVINGKKNEL
jgi:hypothetical protein